MPSHFTHLVLSGGGMIGLSYIGALRFLQVEGIDKGIQHVVGTSIGAMFATIFALRMSLSEVESAFVDMLAKNSSLTIEYPDMLTVLKNYGMDEGHQLLAFLRPHLDKTTFLDLTKRTGINLVICASHLATMKPTYFSVDNTPNVLVYDALRASMAIPWVVPPVKIGDDFYVDGGITDNTPFHAFQNISPSSVLIMQIIISSSHDESSQVMSSPMAYTYAIIKSYLSAEHIMRILERQFPYVVRFERCPVPFLPIRIEDNKISLYLSKNDVENAVMFGYETTYHSLTEILQRP
jgi:predicted acylesterase/phospholipase RssA